MTDGVQRVFGIEYRPIALLKCFLPAGIKVLLYLPFFSDLTG